MGGGKLLGDYAWILNIVLILYNLRIPIVITELGATTTPSGTSAEEATIST